MAQVEIEIVGKDSFSGTLSNFGNIITGIKSAVDLAADAFRTFTGFALQGLDAIASYERLSATFETLIAKELLMTGAAGDMNEALAMSGTKAEELIRWNEELAIKSPFTSEGVAQAFRMAMAYGFTTDEAQRLTQAMIDFAAGSGASEYAMQQIARALGQISATGKLTGGDMLQLVNAGLPVAQILADAFGVTTAEIMAMREKGLIPAKDAIEAITVYLETNFAGAAERQANTWAGLQGTFADLKAMGLREFFGGLFDAIQPIAVSLSEWLQTEGLNQLRAWGETLGAITQKLVDVAMAIGSDPFGAFKDFMNNVVNPLVVSGAGAALVSILTAVGAALVTFWDGSLLAGLSELPLVTIFGSLSTVLSTVLGIVGSVALAVGGLAGGLEILSQATGGLIPSFSELSEKFLTWIDNIDWRAATDKIVTGIQSIDWQAVGKAVATGIGTVVVILDKIVFEIDWGSIVGAIWEALKGVGTGIGDTFWEWFATEVFSDESTDAFFESARIGAGNLGNILLAILLPPTMFITFREQFAELGRSMWEGLIDGLNSIEINITEWVRTHIVDPVKRFLGIASPSTVFMQIGVDIVLGLVSGLGSLLSTLGTFAATLGLSIINGLITGFNAAKNVFLNIVGGIVDAVLNIFQPVLDILGFDIGGGTTGTTGGGAGDTSHDPRGGGTTGSTLTGTTTNNFYFYGTTYVNNVGPEGTFDCPSPHPIMIASSQSLLTSGVA